MRYLFALAALCGITSAHFEVVYPKSIGFDGNKEDNAPCGGFTPDLTKDLVDFHVGGQAVALRLTHQQGNWLFRATTDEKVSNDGKGWEQVYPIVQQSGLGGFCLPQLTLPEKYVGKKGVFSIVSNAGDGLLYQCIAANFVSGSQAAPGTCKNASISTAFVSDKDLTGLVAGGQVSPPSGTSGSGGSSPTSAAPSKTASPGAAPGLQAWPGAGSAMGSFVAAFFLMVVGLFMF